MGVVPGEEEKRNEQAVVQSCTYVNNLNFKSKSAYIQAQLGNSPRFLKTEILIDTGADFNVIDLRLLKQLRH